jgi:hypothetical protein
MSSSTVTVTSNVPAQALTQNVAMTPLGLANYLRITLAAGDSVSYMLTGAPTGITINSSTGVISGTPSAVGQATATWKAIAGTATATGSISFVVLSAGVPPPSGGNCPTMPTNYTVVHSGDSIYGGTWRPDLSSATYVAQLPVGAGVALELPAMTNVYPYGFKVTDSTGGAKNYVISKCPGSTVPVNGQDGTISVNGDSRLDSCKGQGGYVRWIDTSGATASYYNSVYLSFQTTCFLPTTTSQGSGAAATYYINIMNTGSGAVGVQYSNQSQLN